MSLCIIIYSKAKQKRIFPQKENAIASFVNALFITRKNKATLQCDTTAIQLRDYY